jgi:serine/threonine protein kinase
MGPLHGSDLRVLLEREGPLTVPRTVALMTQVCSSLAEAHTKGVIHRDLKRDAAALAESSALAVGGAGYSEEGFLQQRFVERHDGITSGSFRVLEDYVVCEIAATCFECVECVR